MKFHFKWILSAFIVILILWISTIDGAYLFEPLLYREAKNNFIPYCKNKTGFPEAMPKTNFSQTRLFPIVNKGTFLRKTGVERTSGHPALEARYFSPLIKKKHEKREKPEEIPVEICSCFKTHKAFYFMSPPRTDFPNEKRERDTNRFFRNPARVIEGAHPESDK